MAIPQIPMDRHTPTEPDGPTGLLCSWVQNVQLEDIPLEVRTRGKYLILDGIACALVGAHLPWSETAVNALLEMESEGKATVFGWEKKTSPLTAALLNSTFIQGFELDDWHSEAPLHSNSIVLPAVLAAAEQDAAHVSGKDLLLATFVGYEVGPRIGLALHGAHMLTTGWHSGAVFGPSASAAAVCKLFKLPAGLVEDALGIACTQAGGLMSAQFESEVKRMQHGFAARNGLLAAILARRGYVGIKRVYERSYGGFLSQFTAGNGKTPQYRVDELSKALSTKWQTEGVRVKPYAAMAGTHCTVDCIAELQKKHPEQMADLASIESIKMEMAEACFYHGGWRAERPLLATGAQMSSAYVGATQLVDRDVLPAQFNHDKLVRDEVWALVDKTTCEHNPDFSKFAQRVTVTFADGKPTLQQMLEGPRGVMPPLSNEEIRDKWRALTQGIIDNARRDAIESIILDLENSADLDELIALLAGTTKDPLS